MKEISHDNGIGKALCQTKHFSYTWGTRFVGQDISAVLQFFIIILFGHTLNKKASCDLGIALGHIAISVIFPLIVQP